MKKLAFVLLIIQPIISNAQLEKFPTSSDSPIWGYYSIGGYLPSPEFALYGLVGDTIINSKNYSKLYSLTDTILSESSTKEFLGGIRELDNKVYYFNVFSSKEELLYDFSGNLNDTIELNEFGDYAVVKNIDSIIINDNIHKRFHLENPNGTGEWIENIGSIHGLLTNMLYPTDNNPPTTTLVCFKYLNINYYPNYNCGCFDDYFLSTSIDKKKY